MAVKGRPVLVAIGALAIAGAAIVVAADGDSGSARSTRTGAPATTRIVRKDLVDTETVDGTLEHADSRPVAAHLGGTVTRLPSAGTVVRTGDRLYEVDGAGVYLFDGTYPAYRTLAPGITGPDVRQLEHSLRELGFDDDDAMTIDRTWDATTTAAVERWQDHVGMTVDGTIELGRVVFAPGARRVETTDVTLGGSAGGGTTGDGAAASGASAGTVMTTTSTRRVVTVDLATSKLRLARRGATARVTMPRGTVVEGRITDVGSVATTAKNTDGSAGDTTVPVTIAFKQRAGGLDQAPVDVDLQRQRARNALTIPVTALQALRGGRFAVEVHDRGGERVVTVTPGLYTDGDVQITGAGLAAGMTVTDARV